MTLPNELVLETLQYLNKVDLKSARLVSKLWCGCASEHLFAKVFISPHKLNLGVFASIAEDSALRRGVKELEYDAAHFSPHVSLLEYFEILWGQTSNVVSATECGFMRPDPQIQHFVTLLRYRRDHLIPSQESLAQAKRQCCDFSFVQEGYRKWMEQAAFETECSEENTVLKLLLAGLPKFGRLRTIKLRGEWPSRDKLSHEGSPLARSWHPFHARPGGWIFGLDQPLRQSSPSKDFWTLALAISKARKTTIRSLLIESTLPPATFLTMPEEEEQTHFGWGIAAYCRLEDLRISLAGYSDRPMVELYENLDGLHRLLESMTALKRFELDLPDDYVDEPVNFFPYTMIFPANGYWPLLTTFTVRNLAIGTKDLITLLTKKMPNLRHLTFGNIHLIDGQWEGVIEYLRVMNGLSSFNLGPESLLLHQGGKNYLLERPDTEFPRNTYRSYLEFLKSIEDYVVKWSANPILRHPSLSRGQPAYDSVDYLDDVFRRCGMRDMGGTIDKLLKNMLNANARVANGGYWTWGDYVE